MKASIVAKLDHLAERYEELGALLSDAGVISNQDKFRAYSKEYAELEPVVQSYARYKKTLADMEETKLLLQDSDPDMRKMAYDDLGQSEEELTALQLELQKLLLPKDPNDANNIFLEVRAGTGGDEAAIFAGDLFRMYSRYAERKRWRVELISESEGEHGGYKEVICRLIGNDVYAHLKFESGAHRVQRVPETESQGVYTRLPVLSR